MRVSFKERITCTRSTGEMLATADAVQSLEAIDLVLASYQFTESKATVRNR